MTKNNLQTHSHNHIPGGNLTPSTFQLLQQKQSLLLAAVEKKELDGWRPSQSTSATISILRLLPHDWSEQSLEAPAPAQRLVGFPGSMEVIWIRLALWLITPLLVQIDSNIKTSDTQWSWAQHGHTVERLIGVLHTVQLYSGAGTDSEAEITSSLDSLFLFFLFFNCSCQRNIALGNRAASQKR